MAERISPCEMVFGTTPRHKDQIIAMGEKSVFVLADAAERKGLNPRAWADFKLARALGDYRLYLVYEQWVEEYVYAQREPVARHPIFSFAYHDLRWFTDLLRGEWNGHLAVDRDGLEHWVEPVDGQERKVFLVDFPHSVSREYDLIVSYLSRVHFASARKAKVYVYSPRSPLTGLLSNADGMMFNFATTVANKEVTLYNGRRVSVSKPDEVRKAKRFIEAVGFSVDELLSSDADARYRFCIASMRFASFWWDRDTVPMTPLSSVFRPDKGGSYEDWIGAISEKKRLALQGEMEIV